MKEVTLATTIPMMFRLSPELHARLVAEAERRTVEKRGVRKVTVTEVMRDLIDKHC